MKKSLADTPRRNDWNVLGEGDERWGKKKKGTLEGNKHVSRDINLAEAAQKRGSKARKKKPPSWHLLGYISSHSKTKRIFFFFFSNFPGLLGPEDEVYII